MNEITIKTSHIIKRSDDIIASEVDGEIVMMSIEQGKYFGLGSVGSDIWNKLEKGPSVEELCNSLSIEYEMDFDTIKSDVSLFLAEMLENKIIEVE